MNQIKTGAIISYIALFFNIVIGLLYTPWMINAIGKADYGLYTLAMSVISLFVFDFGLGSAITRYVSKYLAEGRQEKVDSLLGLVFKLYIIGDILIFISLVVIYFFLPSIYQGLTSGEMESFKVVYIIASLFCLISFPFIPLNGILTSYEKFVQLKSCDLIHKIIIVAMMTGCLIIGGGLFSLVIVNSVAGVIIIILKLALLGKTKIRAIHWGYWNRAVLKSVCSFSVWVTIIQLAQRCIFNIAPSILAAFTTSTAITILGIAICLEGYTFSFANAINGMFLPRVSRLLANNDRLEILNLMIRIGRIQIYIIGLVCIGFICVGRDFISVWLGEGYEDVYVCALLIILPSLFHLPQEIGNTTIVAEGKVKLQAYAFMLMAIINLAMAYPLTKYFGVVGLCSSIMIAYIVRTITMDLIFYKTLRIDVISFFKESYLKIMPSLMLVVIVCLSINHYLAFSGWIGFIVKTGICTICYVLMVWFFAMNKEEKELVLVPIKKILNRR